MREPLDRRGGRGRPPYCPPSDSFSRHLIPHSSFLVPLLLCAALILAAAAPAPPPHWNRTLEQAHQARAGQDYARAASLYALVYTAEPSPNLAYNVGRCFDLADQWDEARRWYDRWLAASPPVAEQEELRGKLLGQARLNLERQAWAAAAGRLEFSEQLGSQEARDPERLAELARAYEQLGRKTEALELYRTSLELGHPVPAGPLAARDRLELELHGGTLLIENLPAGARASVDGVALVEPARGLRVGAGDHAVAVQVPARRPWSRTVTIRAGETVRLLPELLPEPGTAPPDRPLLTTPAPSAWTGPAAWSAGGGALLTLGLGLTCQYLADRRAQELDDCRAELSCATSARAGALRDEVNGRLAWATGSYVAAGVLALTAGGLWWFGSREHPTRPEQSSGWWLTPAGWSAQVRW